RHTAHIHRRHGHRNRHNRTAHPQAAVAFAVVSSLEACPTPALMPVRLLARCVATAGDHLGSNVQAASRYPKRRETSSAHTRSGLATLPSQSLSNVASGPIAVMPRTRWPAASNTGAQNALIPGIG